MITAEQILNWFPNQSYDPALLIRRVGIVEIIYIEKFLGTRFYTELKTQYDADTLTAVNKEFLRLYLQPLLAHYCMYDSLAMLQAQPRSNGMEFTLPEFGQRADKADVGLTVNKILSTADMLVERARVYLRENSNDYPLYSCGANIKSYNGIIFTDSNSQVYLDRNV